MAQLEAHCIICLRPTLLGDAADGTPLCNAACQAQHHAYIGGGDLMAWPKFAAAWAKLHLLNRASHVFHVQRHILSMVQAVLTGQYRVRKQMLWEWALLFPARHQRELMDLLVDHTQVELQFIKTAQVRGTSEPDKNSKQLIRGLQRVPHSGADFAIERPWAEHIALMHEWIYEHRQNGAQTTRDWQRALAQGAELGRVMDGYFKSSQGGI